ncbi:Tetratricopeptide repeat (TPR)-like superfamily protein [Heracleum sosnowskyi]|uniref:Tetratricopeptide repeat (TPR)-like superfamily protein n=1 Tax=Heracleum sosnowskyi TaxID=360622 RepID=A0AAD8HMN5_9APIA|nr:Tetratricopeptide repeat (TPR)-like superfamily protein [Heracleum sosnowskyi]
MKLLRPATHTFLGCPTLLQSFRNITNSNVVTNTQHPCVDTGYNNNFITPHLSHLLDECTYSKDLKAGFSIHACMIKVGFLSLWNKVLNLYCKCGEFHLARQLFEIMPERNVVSFNTMILACLRNGYVVEGVFLYSEMVGEEEMKPDNITLAGLIGGGGVHLREVLHGHAIRYGLSSNEFVGSSLIDGYAKEKRLEDAIRVFYEIDVRDLVSWNIIIDACVLNDAKGHAWEIFYKMLQENVAYDGFTLTSVMKTCSEARDIELGMSVHCCAIKSGLAFQTPISNALITMYSRCEGGMISAEKIFNGLFAPNIISWTAMIAGFMQNGNSKESVGFYRYMLRLDMRENSYTFASILPAYSNLASLEEGRSIHARIVKSGFEFDLSVNNALIDLYCKCGSLDEAHLVFRTMGYHDRISYTTIITGLGRHGEGKKALEFLKDMLTEGIKPDDITFLGCLYACSHGGHVNDGMHLFKVMVDVYKIRPRREHLSCVVDMLGRAGKLREAEIFIEEMGIESDIFTWQSLLGACNLYGEISLGEKSAKKIMELHPERHGTYVSLANIYAENKLWENKRVTRENLTMSGSMKDIGCSRISN